MYVRINRELISVGVWNIDHREKAVTKNNKIKES